MTVKVMSDFPSLSPNFIFRFCYYENRIGGGLLPSFFLLRDDNALASGLWCSGIPFRSSASVAVDHLLFFSVQFAVRAAHHARFLQGEGQTS